MTWPCARQTASRPSASLLRRKLPIEYAHKSENVCERARSFPQLLELERRRPRAALPQQVDHLAVRAHTDLTAADAALDQAANHLAKPVPDRRLAVHERRQRLLGVHHDELAVHHDAIDIDALAAQLGGDRGAPPRTGDDHDRLDAAHAGDHEARDVLDQHAIVLVELDDMRVRRRLREQAVRARHGLALSH